MTKFLDTQGLAKVSLVGNSMGGGLALALTAQYPERIDRVVLLNPYGLPSLPMAVKNARRPFIGQALPYLLRRFAMQRCAKGIYARSLYNQGLLSKDRLEKWVQPFSSLRQRKNLFRFLRCISPEAIESVDAMLPDIRQAVLILWGKEDGWLSDKHWMRLKDRLPRARVHPIPECGHLPQLEKPDEMATAILPFLSQ